MAEGVIHLLASELAALACVQSHRVSTAESCTGGLVAASCTALSGSSTWFECGFVTYSLEAKQQLLGVHKRTLDHYGAVSEPTVSEMACGALSRSMASLSVSVSGIAGPDGGDVSDPVGTVWFGWARRSPEIANSSIAENEIELVQASRHELRGSRDTVRQTAVEIALTGLLEILRPEVS